MTKISEGRTSGLNYDGGMPWLVNSTELSWLATQAQADLSKQVIPFNATIQELIIAIKGVATDTSARPLNIGTASETTKFVSAYDVDVASLQVIRIPGTTTSVFASNTVDAGDIIEFGLGAGTATSVTAIVGVSLVLVPA